MALKNFNELVEMVKKKPVRKVVVAAAHDEHALEAVLKAHKEGLVEYILVGKKNDIIEKAKKLGYSVDETAIVEATEDQEAAFKAVELIRQGKGDFLMKGKLETSTILKEVVNKETGIGMGGVMSHMAVVHIPNYHKLVGFTDGGMMPHPNLEQKVGILNNSLDLFRKLGYDCPNVAVLCAAENYNPKIPESADAAELKKLADEGKFGKINLEGPISIDLSFSKEAAEIKGYKSPITGDVDILLMPNMATGNISCKGLILFAGAEMTGIILGAKVPVVLTSRGSSFEEKYYALMLCAAQVE